MVVPWGNATWIFFHTLIEKIKESEYTRLKYDLVNIITTVCSCLPCPVCTRHANKHLQRLHIKNVPTKRALQEFIHGFHNNINRSRGHSPRSLRILTKYRSVDFNKVIYNFKLLYGKRYSTTFGLSIHSYNNSINLQRRSSILKKTIRWLISNWDSIDNV
jgi:hypothetical protein